MSTIDQIVYDVALLTAQETNDLLRQLIYRLDRAQPNGETEVGTSKAAAEATKLVEGFASKLNAAGFPDQAAKVLAVLS